MASPDSWEWGWPEEVDVLQMAFTQQSMACGLVCALVPSLWNAIAGKGPSGTRLFFFFYFLKEDG